MHFKLGLIKHKEYEMAKLILIGFVFALAGCAGGHGDSSPAKQPTNDDEPYHGHYESGGGLDVDVHQEGEAQGISVEQTF